MKDLLRTYPNLSRLILGAILIAVALISSGFIHLPFVPAGLLLVVLVTWLMFRTERKNLNALGFNVQPKNLLLIPTGLILGIGLFFLSFYVGTFVVGGNIVHNTEVDRVELLKRFWQVFPTAAVQDFIIVGYCYYKMIQLTNKRIATLVFGIFFITLHDVWYGNFANSLFYALSLFIGYLMFSTALLRSGSIWLPIGIHWGNNFANSYLFTYGRTQTSWLYITYKSQLQSLSVGQAIELFISGNIGTAVVIVVILFAWRSKSRLQIPLPVIAKKEAIP